MTSLELCQLVADGLWKRSKGLPLTEDEHEALVFRGFLPRTGLSRKSISYVTADAPLWYTDPLPITKVRR